MEKPIPPRRVTPMAVLDPLGPTVERTAMEMSTQVYRRPISPDLREDEDVPSRRGEVTSCPCTFACTTPRSGRS